MVKAKYKDKIIECEEITADNLERCKKDGKVGHYGTIEVGNYMYWTGSGLDRFYLVLTPDKIELL